MKSFRPRLCLLALALVVASIPVRAQDAPPAQQGFALKPGDGVVVEFKDGSSMTGVLVKKGRKKIRLDFGGAQMSFGLDTVKSVKPKESDVKKFQDLLKAAGDDFDKLLKAAKFARERGLDTYYDQLVARLGIPNQRDLDDAADDAARAGRTQDAIDAGNVAEAKLEEQNRLQDEAESASLAEEAQSEAAARKAWYSEIGKQRRLKWNAERESGSLGDGVR